MAFGELLEVGRAVAAHRPWPRAVVGRAVWSELVDELAQGGCTLLGLWGEPAAVHMALLDATEGLIGVATLECPDGRFPSVGVAHPPAVRLERAIHDLFGLQPVGASDTRPWLDHGRWDVAHPLGPATAAPEARSAYAFLPAEGENLHQIPVGPVHAGIIEPGHFRFTANGEAVVRLEQRLGYTHKGIDGLMAGASLERAARLAGRVSGDSTVAYAIAFARAVEAALSVEPPARALWLRALMAEMERLANHLGDVGAIANDASFAFLHAECGILREHVLRTADACFGHRLMMDRVVPGGLARDIDPQGVSAVRALLGRLRGRFPALVSLYENTASLQDRTVTTGYVSPALARQYGAGGYVGRASGRAFDARRTPGYAPYDTLAFEVPVVPDGDVNARVWIRIREIFESLALVEQIVQSLPEGAIVSRLPAADGAVREGTVREGKVSEGMALAEAFRGDVLAWVRIGGEGQVARCHLRDASWFQWPLLEAAIEGNIVADFPLCNKSFNCSYSGHDI